MEMSQQIVGKGKFHYVEKREGNSPKGSVLWGGNGPTRGVFSNILGNTAAYEAVDVKRCISHCTASLSVSPRNSVRKDMSTAYTLNVN